MPGRRNVPAEFPSPHRQIGLQLGRLIANRMLTMLGDNVKTLEIKTWAVQKGLLINIE